jgi:hypothetical protein
MFECKKDDERRGNSVEIVLLVGLIILTIGFFLFFCFLNRLSQQAHRSGGYHSQVNSNNDNQDAEDLVAGYLLFGGGGGRRK